MSFHFLPGDVAFQITGSIGFRSVPGWFPVSGDRIIDQIVQQVKLNNIELTTNNFYQ